MQFAQGSSEKPLRLPAAVSCPCPVGFRSESVLHSNFTGARAVGCYEFFLSSEELEVLTSVIYICPSFLRSCLCFNPPLPKSGSVKVVFGRVVPLLDLLKNLLL